MYESILKAIITGITAPYHEELTVMRMNYKIEDNTLWIVDYRNCYFDFDLNEFNVVIKKEEFKEQRCK